MPSGVYDRSLSKKKRGAKTLTCDLCGKEFKRFLSNIHGGKNFCSRICSIKGYKKEKFREVRLNCLTCGKEIITYKCKKRYKKFCSLKCRNIDYAKRRGVQCGFFGKKHTEAVKIKLKNIAFLQGKKPPSRTGAIPWNKGKECLYARGDNNVMRRPEMRAYMSNVQKGCRGNNWKGGVSPLNKRLRNGFLFKQWREEVFKRDKFTCRECGIMGGVLHPHHILGFSDFPTLRYNIDNGITLCASCHQKKHNKIKLSLT